MISKPFYFAYIFGFFDRYSFDCMLGFGRNPMSRSWQLWFDLDFNLSSLLEDAVDVMNHAIGYFTVTRSITNC